MAHNIQLGAADMNHSIKLRYGCQDLHFETGGDDDSHEDDDEEPGDADALDDIYIMMKCLFVTKNHHFLL